jgi:hypothetical protein
MAGSSHFPAVISGPKNTYALLADEAEHAIVFVHGFLGDPRGTWHDFPGLIERDALWGKCDLFFYSYRSVNQIPPLAEDFRSFLHALFVPDPSEKDRIRSFAFMVQPPPLPSGRVLTTAPERIKSYKNVVLVGHSAGAVVIREAILQETRTLAAPPLNPQGFVLNASLRLFAPAHRGAICSGPLGSLRHIPLVSEIVNALYVSWRPLFHNLQVGSPALEDLRRRTEELQDEFPTIRALNAACLFGEYEKIVTIGAYKRDTLYPTEPGQTHVTICKPSSAYLRPLEFVIDAVSGRAATV